MATRNIYIENESAKINAPLATINFNRRHYVPILKTKEGELWALANTCSTRKPDMTPLLELHAKPDTKTLAVHLTSVCGQVAQAWGNRRFFLDTRWHGETSNAHANICAQTLMAASGAGLNFVPVITLSASPAFRQVVRPFTTNGRGLLLRLKPGDFTDVALLEQALISLLSAMELTSESVDVLIDYGGVADAGVMTQLMRDHVNHLPWVQNWRTLTIAGGSFPASVADCVPHLWHPLPRLEWGAWNAAGNGFPLLRKPTFGDYGVRDTQPPSDMGFPYPNIRYTSNGSFLVRRHDVLVKDGGSPGVRAICSSLLQHPSWRGQNFSEGDTRIEINANPQEGPGNAGNWTAWGMNHHFASVIDEIQNLP